MDIKPQIIKIITQIVLENSEDEDQVKAMMNNEDLSTLNLNSVSYIKLIVELENEFQIQFEDETLQSGFFITITDICEYILQKKKENTEIV